MFVRAYLRASTEEQNASRARGALEAFASEHGLKVAAWYVENESGALLQRPELFRLLNDASDGDVLLLEQVDRLARLTESDWKALRRMIESKGIRIVALDLPTSFMLLNSAEESFMGRMLSAINSMMLDMLAAIARKDYEDRRRRQVEGIQTAKEAGAYKGRKADEELHKRIRQCLNSGFSIRKCADVVGCGVSTVQRVKAEMVASGEVVVKS